jgi:hypothetical protein
MYFIGILLGKFNAWKGEREGNGNFHFESQLSASIHPTTVAQAIVFYRLRRA